MADGMMPIRNFDIATVEALHDLLLDKAKLDKKHPTLCNARELIQRMYQGVDPVRIQAIKRSEDNWEIFFIENYMSLHTYNAMIGVLQKNGVVRGVVRQSDTPICSVYVDADGLKALENSELVKITKP